ncbi:MAG: ASCH domain-containing protein, partial [Bacteroidaceae bacterium]|nr:ASCH domain-containing protein [Bacteroidaceae bacterium]
PLELKLIEYDAIQFYVGYNADRDSALVEVDDAVIDIYEEEVYEYKGEEYLLSVVTYKLGKILEVKKK